MPHPTSSSDRRKIAIAVWTFAIVEAAAIGAALFLR
jgi:hypothetical protein